MGDAVAEWEGRGSWRASEGEGGRGIAIASASRAKGRGPSAQFRFQLREVVSEAGAYCAS